MNILVIASGSDSGRVPLRPDNSLYADLYLNGNPESRGTHSCPAGGATQVDVKSVLKVNGRVARALSKVPAPSFLLCRNFLFSLTVLRKPAAL